jgi:hypothetical protein
LRFKASFAMKKTIIKVLCTATILALLIPSAVFAQQTGTLLPTTEVTDCKEALADIEQSSKFILKSGEEGTVRQWFAERSDKLRSDILACGIKTGKIHFWMIPFYIVYVIEFLVGISGVVAILFLVVAAFRYIFAGAAEGQREAAKTSIKNALLGLVIVFASWIVVNTVQFLLTF